MIRVIEYLHNLYRLKSGHVIQPRMLTYIVTFKCNARCIMCDSWKKTDHNDLSFDEILAIFKQMPRLDVVRLTGGEPFVRKDFPEIVDAARKILKPKLIHVTSNGFMNNNIVEFCENRNKTTPLFLLFSVDGMKDKHNHIRGTDIAWDRVTDCIKRLAPRRKALNVRIAVNQTIVDGEGISQYEMLNGYLRQFDINNNLVMAYDASATYDSGTSEKNIAPAQIGEFFTYGDFSKSEIENLFKKAERNLKTYPFIEQILKRYYFKGIKNRLLSGKPVPNPTCVALNAHMRLYPDGRVPVCQFHSASIGNLRTDSFHDVWYGRKASAFREWVSKCPGCWAECEILPNAVYSGDIFRHIV